MKKSLLLGVGFSCILMGSLGLFALVFMFRYDYAEQRLPDGRGEVVKVDRLSGDTAVLRTYSDGSSQWVSTKKPKPVDTGKPNCAPIAYEPAKDPEVERILSELRAKNCPNSPARQ